MGKISALRLLAVSLVFTSCASPQEIEYRTLPELIESGSDSLLKGNFPQAAHAFHGILDNYTEEPIWLDGQLPAKILPLAGFSFHKAGQHTDAVSALELYLSEYTPEANSELFTRYTLATSLLLDNQEQAARAAFAELRSTAGDTPFRDLATIREALLSEPTLAISLLTKLLEDPASPRLASFARLQLIRLHLDQSNIQEARIQLLDTPWRTTQMPDLATLSYLATQVADALQNEHPDQALRAYQLVQPKQKLIAAQQARISQLATTYQQRAPTLRTEQSMWSDQYRQSIALLRKQLDQLKESPHYSQAIDLRKARCFAQVNRPLEAWILLEPIALSTSSNARQAHLDWISVARQMQAWNAAALIAQEFLKKYPDDEHAPQALFWIALSQVEQSSFAPAIATLQTLLDHQPTNQLAAAARYYQGYCYFSLKKTALAIAAFRAAADQDPSLPISGQAELWIGICQFTTNQLEAAKETFDRILAKPDQATLHAEASYRKIAAQYALGQIDLALPSIDEWLATYSLHPREAEAYLLQGDMRAELGQLELAIASYNSVETADPELAFFALEKSCTLQLELDATPAALTQLETYRTAFQVPAEFIGPYTSLLVYCLEASGNPQQARIEINQAIQTHGNNPQAGGILSLIQQTDTSEDDAQITSEHGNQTLASRYLVAEIHQLRASDHLSEAKTKALQLVSKFDRTALPPEALIEAGRALAEIQSLDAPLYLNSILELYPTSPYTDESYFELARYHYLLSENRIALDYLALAEISTPESLALRIDLEFALGDLDAAKSSSESQLADRQAAPHQKAQALSTLGQIAQYESNPTQAYTYYQRIFTLYRGEAEFVAPAYLACFEILCSQNRYEDARSVATEFLAQPDLKNHPAHQTIQTLLETLPPPDES